MLRSFAYDKVLNVSCRGDVYETQLNWEWDSATLDLAEKYGWGPGLTVGEMVKVRVLRPDGSPANGAKVWADGRNYSFDLPIVPSPPTVMDGPRSPWALTPIELLSCYAPKCRASHRLLIEVIEAAYLRGSHSPSPPRSALAAQPCQQTGLHCPALVSFCTTATSSQCRCRTSPPPRDQRHRRLTGTMVRAGVSQ